MSTLSWDTLYSDHTDAYERLVLHEDYQGNLIAAIETIQPLAGANAAELGCGTGRVTGLLARRASRVRAFDLSPEMLGVAQAKKGRLGWDNVSLTRADHRDLPARDGWADFAIEGWAFLHLAVRHPDDWQAQFGRALDEMRRVVRPGGKLILIETLGTGETAPNPAPHYRQVYDWLEAERGFTPVWIRTDYRFATLDTIRKIAVPLFGERMLEVLIETPQGIVLPECTGLWWREA